MSVSVLDILIHLKWIKVQLLDSMILQKEDDAEKQVAYKETIAYIY